MCVLLEQKMILVCKGGTGFNVIYFLVLDGVASAS